MKVVILINYFPGGLSYFPDDGGGAGVSDISRCWIESTGIRDFYSAEHKVTTLPIFLPHLVSGQEKKAFLPGKILFMQKIAHQATIQRTKDCASLCHSSWAVAYLPWKELQVICTIHMAIQWHSAGGVFGDTCSVNTLDDGWWHIWFPGKSWRRIFCPWSTLHLKAICHRYFLLVCTADCLFVFLFELEVFCLCIFGRHHKNLYFDGNSPCPLLWEFWPDFIGGVLPCQFGCAVKITLWEWDPPLTGKIPIKSGFLWERPFSCVAVFWT